MKPAEPARTPPTGRGSRAKAAEAGEAQQVPGAPPGHWLRVIAVGKAQAGQLGAGDEAQTGDRRSTAWSRSVS